MDQLYDLLNLSCIITTGLLSERPILKKALRNNDDLIYIHKVIPNESLKQFLGRIYNNETVYDMDCSLYAQLCSLVLDHKWPIDGGEIKLYICRGKTGKIFFQKKSQNIGYIRPTNIDTWKYLIEAYTDSKGQWVYQINNKYLGLTSDGPKLLSLKEWHDRIVNGLKKYIDSPIPKQNQPEIHGMIKQYYDNNAFSEWGFFDELTITPKEKI